MKCPSCQGENTDNAKFCRHCGSPMYDNDYSSTKLPLGTELDNRYRIVDYIAKGGMGAVYKAVDLEVSKVWAVKEMLDYFDSENEREYAVERFATEAQILYDLDHRSIPRFVDCFVADNRYYLIMEHIDGTDLRKMLEDAQEEGKLGLKEEDVIRWMIQICDVLFYLHTQDPPIIYRDMKPGNIMITKDDQVYLIDFGIARLFDPRTKGTMVGTQGYAPPEQYRGEAEPRSDIYSLAACMHHLLTGKDPRNDIPFNFPPVRTIRDELSQKIENILEKALSMEPQDRFLTAFDMKKALESREFFREIEGVVPAPEYGVPRAGEISPLAEPVPVKEVVPVKAIRTDIAIDESAGGKMSLWYMHRCDRRHSGKSPFGSSLKGKPLWKMPIGSPIRSSPVIGGDGEVYVGSNDGCLYSINGKGKVKWRYQARTRILSSPTLDRLGNVYFGANDCHVFALNHGGELLWKFKTYGRVRSSPCIGLDGIIYVGSYDHYLYAIFPDGTLKWRIDLGGHLESTPAISDDGSIVLSCRGTFNNGESYLYSLNSAGNILWYQELGGPSLSSPCIARNGKVYLGASDGCLYSMDLAGNMAWRFQTEASVISSPVVDEEGNIYFGSMDGHVYSVSVDGDLLWKYKTRSSVTSSAALGGNNNLYIGSDDYYVYALLAKGAIKWKYKCGGRVRSSPAIGQGDTMYVGSDDGILYAFK